MSAGIYRSPELPWSISEEEEQRYRRYLKRGLWLFLVCALVIPWLPVPQVAREEVEELPPRLAKLILEREPPPVVKAPEPELTKPEPKQEIKKAEPKKVEPAKPNVEAARAKAERAGLLAFKDELSDLRSHSVASKLEKNPTTNPAPAAARSPDRALITSNATAGSGGIQTARLSQDTGGGGLAGRATPQLDSPVGAADAGASVRRGASGKASRSIEDIKLVFDRNKGAIYTLYNRALREDSTLQGKVVVKLTIAPSGQVLDCQLVSSELRSPELERRLLARIRQFDFGARAVDTMIVTYPIDFLPS
jgi:protein TonB